jgi:hypothetical protein
MFLLCVFDPVFHVVRSLVVRLNDFVLVRYAECFDRLSAPRRFDPDGRSPEGRLPFVARVSAAPIDSVLSRFSCPQPLSYPPPQTHYRNHQTHHRNQVVEMWETEAGSKEMKCQWFYRPAECQHESLGVDPGHAPLRSIASNHGSQSRFYRPRIHAASPTRSVSNHPRRPQPNQHHRFRCVLLL